jgi:hypothetical protein
VVEELALISSSEIESLRLELKRTNEDLNSKKHEIECMEKGKESSDSIYKREMDILSSGRLKLIDENRSLRDQLVSKKNEVDYPPLPMNDSSRKLPGWLSDDLRPFVYKLGLEDKVIKLGKEYDKEDILEALQELLPWNEEILLGSTDTLPNQSVHSRPAHSKKSISWEGGAEAISSAQAMPLAPTIPVIASFSIAYSILTLLLIAVI